MRRNIIVATILGSLSVNAAVLTPPVINPANGHFYTLLSSNTWTGSQAEAVAMGGNLATIDDMAENNWVFDTFSGGQRNLWIGLNDVDLNDVFTWADGTAFTFSNWDLANNQPDLGPQHWVFIVQGDLGHGLNARKWHDIEDDPGSEFAWVGPIFGVVEQATAPFCSPHRATATATVVDGAVIGATITDFGCGYTNAPLVLIQGGEGSGATATAVLSNGVVAGINITSVGCCYSTNPLPRIEIASPPFVPTVAIAVSRVNVTQHVVLGRSYVLESSADLITWTPTGPQFTALSEDITTEFVVNQTGQYFRIRQVL
jgi:Lectin C-type domain.